MEASFDRLLTSITEHFVQLKETGTSSQARVLSELEYLQGLMIDQLKCKTISMFDENDPSPEYIQRSSELKQSATKLRVLYELIDDFKSV